MTEQSMPIRCLKHNQLCLKGCTDLKCTRTTLLCQKCLNEDQHMEHRELIYDMSAFLAAFPAALQRTTKSNKDNLERFLANDSNVQIFKSLQEDKGHLSRIKDKFMAYKVGIASDITNLVEIMQQKLQEIKEALYKTLDQQLQEYENVFTKLKTLYSTTFYPASIHYYASPSAFPHKLASLGNRAENVLYSLCQFVRNAKLYSNGDIQELQRICNSLLQMQESQIPQRNLDALDQELTRILTSYFNRPASPPQKRQQYTYPDTNIIAPKTAYEIYNIDGSGRTAQSSAQATIMQSNQWVHAKLMKIFALDFSPVAICSLSSNHFAMFARGDTGIRLFNRGQSSINIYNNEAVQQLQFMESMGGGALISVQVDGSILYWELKNEAIDVVERMQFGCRIVHALSISNNSFAFIDYEGKIGFYRIGSKTPWYIDHFKKTGKQFRLAACHGKFFYAYISGEESAVLIQIGESSLRVVSARKILSSPMLIATSIDKLFFLSSLGLRLPIQEHLGQEVNTLSVHYILERVTYIISIDNSTIYRITDNNEISQQLIKLDRLGSLYNASNPPAQLFKENDKLMIAVVSPDTKELIFYETHLK